MTKIILCKDAFGREYQVPVNELKIRVGVYAVIIVDDKILLTRQWDGYSIIGGGAEKGETLEEAFVREVKEETGLDASPSDLIHHATTFFKKDEASQAYQSYQFYITHKTISGKIQNRNITESERDYTNGVAEWVDLDRINDINFRHSVELQTILDAVNR